MAGLFCGESPLTIQDLGSSYVGRVALPPPTSLVNCPGKYRSTSARPSRHCEPARAWQSPGTWLCCRTFSQRATHQINSSNWNWLLSSEYAKLNDFRNFLNTFLTSIFQPFHKNCSQTIEIESHYIFSCANGIMKPFQDGIEYVVK